MWWNKSTEQKSERYYIVLETVCRYQKIIRVYHASFYQQVQLFSVLCGVMKEKEWKHFTSIAIEKSEFQIT